MPDVRQGIVLRHDGHRGPGARALDGRPEGRGQAAHTPLDPRPLLLEEAREPRRGLFLLEAQLGIGVDLKRELFQLVGQAIDGVRDLGLGLVERVSGHGRTPPWRPSRVRGRPAGHRSSWPWRSEEHTSELQSRQYLVCRLLLEKKKKTNKKCRTTKTNTTICYP